MHIAVLDANVLFRSSLRDFLLSIAEAGTFLPAWSDVIHDEWMRNRIRVFGDPIHQLASARDRMDEAFPGSNMPADPEVLMAVERMCISDGERKDAHVIATAIVAEATTIVTFNRIDFAPVILDQYGLQAEHPEAFCERLFALDRDAILHGARSMRRRLKAPPFTAEEFLKHIADGIGCQRLAESLQSFVDYL
jgi:hypothetical protein